MSDINYTTEKSRVNHHKLLRICDELRDLVIPRSCQAREGLVAKEERLKRSTQEQQYQQYQQQQWDLVARGPLSQWIFDPLPPPSPLNFGGLF